MITLIPIRPHWLTDNGEDNPNDLCAHSLVHLEIHGEVLLSVADGSFTVSACAIYLLRTLERDHSQLDPVGEKLFPCCGRQMYDMGGDEVEICGCPAGDNFYVTHGSDSVCISTDDDRSWTVPVEDWHEAVTEFAESVWRFYDASLPKTPETNEEAEGFALLMEEWGRRRSVD